MKKRSTDHFGKGACATCGAYGDSRQGFGKNCTSCLTKIRAQAKPAGQGEALAAILAVEARRKAIKESQRGAKKR